MLVLKREIGQAIVITTPKGPLRVVVVEIIDGYKVRLGFEGDRAIEILREELVGEPRTDRPP